MKHLFASGLFLLFSLNALCQKQAAVWYFGNSAGLDFNCSPPRVIRAAKYFGTIEASATICDTSGNILFYTFGDSVWNRKHETMPNGYGLGQKSFPIPGSSSQGAIIIPVPKSNSLFYVFTTDNAENRLKNGFRYSIVDMTKDAGLGDVTTKAQLLIDSVCEKLTATFHTNGEDIWVVTHQYRTDAFYAYLVTQNGLDPNPVISHTGQIMYETKPSIYPESMARGQLKFSPDGKKLIMLTYSDHHIYPRKPEMFSFDASTGKVTSDFEIDDKDSVGYYGASFSPNNKILYLTSGWHGKYVHQFDLTNVVDSKSFLDSRTVVHEYTELSNPPFNAGISLGPDGKIYLSSNKTWVDVIENPNVVGAGCNFKEKAIILKNCEGITFSNYSMPNFIQSYFTKSFTGRNCDSLGAGFTFHDSCLNHLVSFTSSSVWPENINYQKWNFNDLTSGDSNTSEELNPKHLFHKTGTYYVKLFVTQNGPSDTCYTDSITLPVQIVECAEDTIIPVTPDTLSYFYVPTAFSPNDDEHNPVFRITGNEIKQIHMRIYNMWGEKILDEKSINPEWDGNYLHAQCPAGVYVVLLEIVFSNGESRSYTGNLRLIR
ncbi:MAG: hypothetical protein GC181_08260 [Bacteroidetes bacterium]|nr:hypothetical protein [Bacteroidota bacterium]